MPWSLRTALGVTAGITLAIVASGAVYWNMAASEPAADTERNQQATTTDAAFLATWLRMDGPVAGGAVQRTWIWGPQPLAGDLSEPYAEGPGGARTVRYYDKSRMELTDPAADPQSPWYVTTGLLVRDLVTGQRQTGAARFEQRSPASINVAGDPDDPAGPTYASLAPLLVRPARPDGSLITERFDSSGQVTDDPSLTGYGVTSTKLVDVPGLRHQVAGVFWSFMNGSGPVEEGSALVDGAYFSSPFYATGYPLTEAYWTTVQVAGQARLVLFQAFERRVLTYTPDNPPGWQVESGNVGQHYYRWLYENQPPPPADPTPTAEPSATVPPAPATATATATATETTPAGDAQLVVVGDGAVDAWMRSVVRDAEDRVWIVALNNNAFYQEQGAGELRVYRAEQTGRPESFQLQAGLTRHGTDDGQVSFADAAIDGQNRLHVVWVDRGAPGQPLLYQVLDLSTGAWLDNPEPVDQTGLEGFGGNAGQGGVSLAFSPAGELRVAYVADGNHTQVRVRTRQAAGWSAAIAPVQVERAFVWHPVLAVTPAGVWHLAAYDATDRVILATWDAGQGWAGALTVADDVLGPENIDQSPALLVDAAGRPAMVYLDGGSYLRVSRFADGGWLPGELLGHGYFTHAPGIGVFADGTLVISGHDEFQPPTAMNLTYGRDAGWSAWEPFVELAADGSAVFRWAGAFSTPGASAVDLVFFDEDSNDDGVFDDQTLYYVAVPWE